MSSFLDRIFRSNPLNVPGAIDNLMSVNSFLESFGGQHKSDSGEIVNHHTSLQTAAVWACVNLISQQIATNPFFLYQYDGKGNKTLAGSHDYFQLVSSQPNPEQDAISFRTAVEMSVLLSGNGYIEIQRDNGNRAVALWHRSSERTGPFRRLNGQLVYRTTDSVDQEIREIPLENMIHIMGMTLNGFIGLSPIAHHAQTIGRRIAMDKYGGRFFANNATPSGILTTKLKVKPEDKPKMRADWEMQQLGGNQHRVNILDQDLTFQPITIPQNDAQFLESSNASAEDIASIYGVPGYAIGLLTKSVKANIEQQAQDLYNYCLRPRMAKWEQAFTNKLFNARGRSAGRYAAKFDVFAMLHPDSASLMVSNQSSIQNGVMSPNEARATLGLNSIGPVGDTHYIQLNMQTLELANSTAPVDDNPDTELALEQEENSKPRLGSAYRVLFKDGVQRLIRKNNRDHKAVYQCLWPTLDALACAARSGKKLQDFSESTKAVDKLIEGIEHRSKKWVIEDIETICDDELKRVATKLIYAVNHDVANAKSKADLALLEADETEQENENE